MSDTIKKDIEPEQHSESSVKRLVMPYDPCPKCNNYGLIFKPFHGHISKDVHIKDKRKTPVLTEVICPYHGSITIQRA